MKLKSPQFSVPIKFMTKMGKNLTCWVKGIAKTFMSALEPTDIYIPPTFIFARKPMKDHLMKNGPPGAIYPCLDNGCITEEFFWNWIMVLIDGI